MAHPVDDYAEAVVAGRVPAGTYHRLACQRHLKDRAREGTPGFPYRFDLTRAERFFRFAQQLKHYKGEWAGQFIKLEPHQLFRKGSKWGWVHVETGLRRFRHSYEEIPRKNGKTLELAIETLYGTFFDGEPGGEGYVAATKRDQALIIFRDCQLLVKSSGLRTRLKVQVGNIHHEASASKLEPLGADHDSTDGLNPNVVTLDEMHALKHRGMIDVLETATGARRQPMINKITTAGNDLVSPCGDEHDYACKILEGVLVDETYFAFIAHADPEDDWTLRETARKANPNYGVSVNPEDLASKVVKAQGIPKAAATYQQKHLNLWVNTFAPSLSVEGWQRGQTTWDPEELRGEACYVGIDLGSKLDFCAMALLFPPTGPRATFRVIQYIWTPADTLLERAHMDRAPYDLWVAQGWLRTTPGSKVDYDVIREALRAERERFALQEIGFDDWHAETVQKRLIEEDGFGKDQVLSIPQTFKGLSHAMLEFKGLVLAGQVDARGCPVTAWAISNTVEQTDGKGNIYFTKKRSRGRIDPVMAIADAMHLYQRKNAQPTTPEPTVLVVGGRKA